MSDDLNTPVAIAQLFDAVRIINLVSDGKEKLTAGDIDLTYDSLQHLCS
ncbi:MAG: hypothetical protein MZV63_47365 [Marinilabiliales bacterium]|nr:hypothetical protein [Marinilabiliales bacterium]